MKNAISKIVVNMDCFLLIKGQWKLFKGQGKVREFFTFYWVATMFQCLWKIAWLLNYKVLLLLNFRKTSLSCISFHNDGISIFCNSFCKMKKGYLKLRRFYLFLDTYSQNNGVAKIIHECLQYVLQTCCPWARPMESVCWNAHLNVDFSVTLLGYIAWQLPGH